MKHACEAISRLASEKLERNLSLVESIRLRLHLLMCSACRHYDVHITKLHQVLNMKHKASMSGVKLPEDKRQKIQAVLKHSSSE